MEGVTYKLELGTSPADPELIAAVQQLEVEDHAELADMIRLRVTVAQREDASDWALVDAPAFRRLAKVRVSVKVGARPAEALIEAHVIDSSVTFSNEPGRSSLTVVGMDSSVLLDLDEKVRPWPDMSDSDIAGAIFGEHGVASQVEATRHARQELDRTTIQRGTDMQFLRQLAARNGYECYVELDDAGQPKWHFHPPALDVPAQGVLSVNLGESTNVDAFRVRNDMLRPATAQASTLDIETREAQPASSERHALRDLGPTSAAPDERPRTVLISQTGLSDSGELQTYAQALVDRSSWAVSAEGELNAIAYGGVLRAKRPVRVRGAGQRYSGTYYVHRVHHAFGPAGYSQRFTLRRNALGVESGERFTEDRALPA